jgi:ribosome recycling factor
MEYTEEEQKRLAAKLGLRDNATPSLEESLFSQADVVSPPQDPMIRDLIANAKADALAVEVTPLVPAKTTEVSPSTNIQAAPNVVAKPVTNTAIPSNPDSLRSSDPASLRSSITPESALATGLTDISTQKGVLDTAKTNLETDSGKAQQNYDEVIKLYGDREAYSNKLSEIKKQQYKHEQEITNTQKEVSDISNKIGQWSEDPNRFFRNLGTGQKISLAIAGIASMVGAAFSGAAGRSPSTGFVDIIMKNIDNDIAAQRSDLSKMKESRAAKESLLGIMQGRYDDTVKAETLAKASQIEAAKLKITQMQAKATSEQAKINLEMAKGELDNRKNILIQTYLDNKNKQFNQGIAQAQLGLEAEKMGAELQPKQIYGDDVAIKIQTMVPEKQRAQAFEELSTIAEYRQSKASIEKTLSELANIGGISGNIPFSEASAKADAGRASILATLQGVWKGPMSDRETKLAQDLIPVPSDTTAQAEVKKRLMLEFVDRNKKQTPLLKHYGILGNTSPDEKKTINAIPRK